MNSDFEDLLALFNQFSVKYLLVGGYAVIKYTQPRYTGGLDIWIEASEENSSKAYAALEEFGAPIASLAPKDFERPGFFFQMGLPPNRIVILMSISGVDFAEAWNRKISSTIEHLEIYFISQQDLMTNKAAMGRPKDLADLDALKKAKF